MKGVLRTFLLWFLLAGVPLQGFASATMLLCGAQPAAGATRAAGHHDHASLLAARHGEEAPRHAAPDATPDLATDVVHRAGAHHEADASQSQHATHAKCASAGACCTGAPLAPVLPAAPPVQDGRCATVPFVPAAPAAVDLAGLERPPKSAAA